MGSGIHTYGMRLWSFIIYDQYGEILFNAIPCNRDSDSSKGIFDSVSQVYFPYLISNPFVKTWSDYYEEYVYSLKYPANSKLTMTMNCWYEDDSGTYQETRTVAKGSQNGGIGCELKSVSPSQDSVYMYGSTVYG